MTQPAGRRHGRFLIYEQRTRRGPTWFPASARYPHFHTMPMMSIRPTLFDLMSKIVRANTDVLQAYRTDFWLHDQYALLYCTRPGDEYIWILREYGTVLFRLYQGSDPVPVSHWLTLGGRQSRAYHVVCTDHPGNGTVARVSSAEAIRLAILPQRGPLTLTPREQQLLAHLKDVLGCIGYSHQEHVRRAAAFVDRLEFTAASAA